MPPRKRFVTTKVEVEGCEEIHVVELPDVEPTPWAEDAALQIVGQRVLRADALEKVTGRARYTADLHRPAMLYAAFLRAPVASGHVTRLDPAAALATFGVRGVLLAADVVGIVHDGAPLFDSNIHYAGQPLAAICADTPELARYASTLIALGIDETPHAVTTAAALAPNAPKVRPKGNTPRHMPRVIQRGDADAGLREADVTIIREYRTPCALHTAMEPHGAAAEFIGDDLTVWESTQGIFMVRGDVARAFHLPLNRVRVMKDYMGGGFGAKNNAGTPTPPSPSRRSLADRCAASSTARASRWTPATGRPPSSASPSARSVTALSPPSRSRRPSAWASTGGKPARGRSTTSCTAAPACARVRLSCISTPAR